MSASKILFAALVGFYAVMWIGGVGHYVWLGGPPLDAPWAASLFLLLAGLLVILTSPKMDLFRLSITAVIGFSAEVLGVRYGFIFGPYCYTDVLQPQLLDVPLVMMSAWVVLVSYIRQMLMNVRMPFWLDVAGAAAWMTAIDLVIDPLAANQLGYWRWVKSGAYYGIPLHNFAGWFVVGSVIFGLVGRKWEPNLWVRYVGLSIVLFFTVIALSHGMILAGMVGICLCFIHFVSQSPWRVKNTR
jgi:putative membrane protein